MVVTMTKGSNDQCNQEGGNEEAGAIRSGDGGNGNASRQHSRKPKAADQQKAA